MEIARAVRSRLGGLGPAPADVALALGLGLLTIVELVRLRGDLPGPSPPAQWPLLAAATIAPLAWRRRYPLAVLAAQAAAETATAVISGHLGFSVVMIASLLIGAYSAGAHANRRGWSLVLVLVSGVAPGIALGMTRLVSGSIPGVDVVIPLTAWLIGHAVRGHRRQIADLRERAVRLERESAATARAAVAEERARIARELHDVVAHSVSVMVVQAEAARRILSRRPDEAEAALRTVSATGSEALTELRHLLGVLAGDGSQAELEPAPGLRDLDSLMERVGAAGLRVEVRVDGQLRSLPRGVDLTAYRIVQEALTNVLKHAGTSQAAVALRFAPDCLGIEVTDAGRTASRPNGAGRGLVGMRERVAAYGGELETGPRPEGGYAVRVRLPLEVGG